MDVHCAVFFFFFLRRIIIVSIFSLFLIFFSFFIKGTQSHGTITIIKIRTSVACYYPTLLPALVPNCQYYQLSDYYRKLSAFTFTNRVTYCKLHTRLYIKQPYYFIPYPLQPTIHYIYTPTNIYTTIQSFSPQCIHTYIHSFLFSFPRLQPTSLYGSLFLPTHQCSIQNFRDQVHLSLYTKF